MSEIVFNGVLAVCILVILSFVGYQLFVREDSSPEIETPESRRRKRWKEKHETK